MQMEAISMQNIHTLSYITSFVLNYFSVTGFGSKKRDNTRPKPVKNFLFYESKLFYWKRTNISKAVTWKIIIIKPALPIYHFWNYHWINVTSSSFAIDK